HPLRAADGPAAVPGGEAYGYAPAGGARRAGAGAAAATESPLGSGNDLPQVSGEGAGQALRQRGGPGTGPAPLPGGGADPGPAGGRRGTGLALGQTEPGPGGSGGGADGGRSRFHLVRRVGPARGRAGRTGGAGGLQREHAAHTAGLGTASGGSIPRAAA